ncbi:MAG: cob(I)yrinic acid a,c-diamide adenosyltransferase [Saprospiraceae bacterium]|nr:cob(I)yrinic acid a,c-diamide adenosyltransferase [Saprospiraceae bacterium]
MKIYTRTGDKGLTSLLGGSRVPKSHLKIEAYGTVDELNSYIGLLRDHKELDAHRSLLTSIQENLFTAGSILAVEEGKSFDYIPDLKDEFVKELEDEMDKMDARLPEMRNFVLPGGHPIISHCHIARCVCRRAERTVIALSSVESVDDIIIRYLNRLSDFLFVLGRELSLDLGVEEIPWRPTK